MRFSLWHHTTYHYSVPVQLCPHVVRLAPRPESARTVSRALLVQPQPTSQLDRTDVFGNLLTDLSFYGWTQFLQIESKLDVETLVPAPLYSVWPSLPWQATTQPSDWLAEYLTDPNSDLQVHQFASDLAHQVSNEPLAFLDRLTQTLCSRTAQELRMSGDAQPAAATLMSARGSCRDLAVLFMSACRGLGIPSRFVSGYLAPIDQSDSRRQLHAWAEVFLPGVGWRGWDPSQGERVTDKHLPVCVAPAQRATMPVEGTYVFNGEVVTTTLDYDIRMRAI